jgi:hypothetical protein
MPLPGAGGAAQANLSKTDEVITPYADCLRQVREFKFRTVPHEHADGSRALGMNNPFCGRRVRHIGDPPRFAGC